MTEPIELLGLYLHLAQASQLRRRMFVRDRLLVIAGVLACQAGLWRIAAYCRHKILEHNPGHSVGRWPRLEAALRQEDFQSLLKQILRRYPQEKAEQMLVSLEIERGQERQTYGSDEEYAASLLGVTPEVLEQMFGR